MFPSGSVWHIDTERYWDVSGSNQGANRVYVSDNFRLDVVECDYCHNQISVVDRKLPERCPGCGSRRFRAVTA